MVRTAEATNEVFPEVEQEIRATARRFAARYGRDQENVLSEAFELFIAAHREKFDPSRGLAFPKFLKSFLWNRLLDKTRHYAQKAAKMPLDRGALTRGIPDRRPRFDRDAVEDRLTADGRVVLAAVLDGGPGLPLDPVEIRRAVKAQLAEQGWDRPRIAAAFRDVRGVL